MEMTAILIYGCFMETKIYSSSGFAHQCSTAELYVLTRHWLSDILFFEQELEFFQSLLQRCFSIEEEDQRDRLDSIQAKLSDLRTRLELLSESVNLQQSNLGAILDKNVTEPFSYNNMLQSKLEGELFDFIKTFRLVKQQVFKFSAKCLLPNPHI